VSHLWRSVGEVVTDLEQRIARDGDWQISPWPGELFAADDLTGAVTPWSDRGVSVHAAQTDFAGADRGLVLRDARRALLATSRIALRYVITLTIDSGTDAYRTALDAEADLVTRVLTPPPGGSPVRVLVDSATRAVLQDAYLAGEIRLSVTHHMPLSP
jgi:hypothetical protein